MQEPDGEVGEKCMAVKDDHVPKECIRLPWKASANGLSRLAACCGTGIGIGAGLHDQLTGSCQGSIACILFSMFGGCARNHSLASRRQWLRYVMGWRWRPERNVPMEEENNSSGWLDRSPRWHVLHVLPRREDRLHGGDR